jgi:hypothetical protein
LAWFWRKTCAIASDEDFEAWWNELQPILTTVMAELNLANESHLLQRTRSLVANGDQLRTLSRELMDWIADHRCPVADVDVALTKLGCLLEWLAEVLESESNNPAGPDLPLIGQELDSLRAAILDVGPEMQRESER